MFQPRVSGIQQMYNQIVPVLTVIADEAALKAALASGGSLASMIAAYQDAQNLKAALAALSQSGNPAEAAYAAQLSPKVDAVITAIAQTPITVKDLTPGGSADPVKDANGNAVTVGSFLQNPSAVYNWTSGVPSSGGMPTVGWVQIDANGNTTTPPGITVSASQDTHGNTTVSGSGAGSAIEAYASVQISAAASAAINGLENSF